MSALRDAMSHAVLGWVKPELDETLRQARGEIEAFVENPADSSRMRFCAGYLHQVQGTLRMVELYAPAMVAEEMELLAQALQQGAANDRDEACATLMRGTVLLPDYLERLQNGHRDIPIVLLPLLNDIRAARGAAGLNESVLFAPDLNGPLPEQVPGSVLPWPQRQDRVVSALAGFQAALEAWPEGGSPADPAGLARLAGELQQDAGHENTRRMLWVLSCVANALRDGALGAGGTLRAGFVAAARALQQATENEALPASARGVPSQEPTRQLLYAVAQARNPHPALDELRRAFDLDALVPSEAELDHARGSLAGRNRDLLDTVGGVVKEELLRVKDALDLHLRTGGDAASLQPQAAELTRVADTLGMLGLGVARDVVLQQRDSLQAIAAGDAPASEGALLDIAGALLYVDASLDDQVARLGAGEEGGEDAAAAEASRTVEVLAHEAIANFAAAREDFVAFIETNWDHARLETVPRLLEEVAGALRMLELPEPADYLEGVRRYIVTELIGRRRVPSGRQLDTLADAMASLEYYLEALRDRRPNRGEILEIARSSLESLDYWPLPEEPAADAGAQADAGSVAAAGAPDATVAAAAAVTVPAPESAAPPPLADAGLGWEPVEAARPTGSAPVADEYPQIPAMELSPRAPASLELEPTALDDLQREALEPLPLEIEPPAITPAPLEIIPPREPQQFTYDPASGEYIAVAAAPEPAAPDSAGDLSGGGLGLEPASESRFGSGFESTFESTFEPAPGATAEPAAGLGLEPAFEPVSDLTLQPIPEPGLEPDSGPSLEPASEAGFEPEAAATAIAPSGLEPLPPAAAVPPPLPPLPVAPVEHSQWLDLTVHIRPRQKPGQEAAAEPVAGGTVEPVIDPVTGPAAVPATEAAAEEPATGFEPPAGAVTAPAAAAAGLPEPPCPATAAPDTAADLLDEASVAAAALSPWTTATSLAPEGPVLGGAVGAMSGGFDDNHDIDADIREVFLEEFEEERGNLARMLPVWVLAPEDMERLRPIRRVFHTLKGSGRLVGAGALGEFAWRIEGMLNRVLDGSRPASPAVIAMVRQASELLPQFDAALRGQAPLTLDLRGLEGVAERIAAGEEAFYSMPAAAAPEAAPAGPASLLAAEGTPASVDSVLREILETEVAIHLETVDAWIAAARQMPQPVSDPLLRAMHTMNGAFAMTDVPEITSVTDPAETFIKRAIAAGHVPGEEAVEALADTAATIRGCIVALQAESPRIPSYAPLAARLRALAEALPEARWLQPEILDDEAAEMPVPLDPTAELTGVDLSRFLVESLADAGGNEVRAAGAGTPQAPEEAAEDVVQADGFVQAVDTAEAAEVEAAEIGTIDAADAEMAEMAETPETPETAETAETADLVEGEAQVALHDTQHAVVPDATLDSFAQADAALDATFAASTADGVADGVAAGTVDDIAEGVVDVAASDIDTRDVADAAASADGLAADASAADAGPADTGPADASVGAPAPASAGLELEAMPSAVGSDATAGTAEPAYVLTEVPAEAAPEADTVAPAAVPAAADADLPMLDFDELDRDLVDIFVEEGGDLLDHVDALLVELRADTGAREAIIGLQRDLHTLKGGARMAGIATIGDLGHVIESLLEAVAEHRTTLDRGDVHLLERGFDTLHQLLVKTRAHRITVMPHALISAFEARIRGEAEAGVAPQAHADLAEVAGFVASPADGREAGFADSHEHTPATSPGAASEALPVAPATVTGTAEQDPAIEVEEQARAAEAVEQAAAVEAGIRTVESGEQDPAVGATEPAPVVAAVPEAPELAEVPAATVAREAGDVEDVSAALPALAPLSAPIEDEASEPADEVAARAPQEQVRVRADLLDNLVNHAGEVAIYRSRLEQQLGAFRSALAELDRTNARLRDQLRRLDLETEAQIVARYQREQDSADPTFDPLELDRFSTLQQLSRALNESSADLTGLQGVLDDLSRQYDVLLQQQSRVSSDLQDGLMSARMVPFDSVVPRLRRVVRQAGHDTGKQVQLRLDGTHGELDRNVLDRMVAPIEHMLRNSVAHGLETPAERAAAGKAEEGGITISLRHEGSEIVLQVADDGRGLDREAIRRRAEQRGLLKPGAVLTDAELDSLIFEAGFSTSEQVSQLAGRGVGMDVVRNEVRQLGGTVEIDSVLGRGVVFTLRLPQTLAVTQAVFVQIGDTTYAVPVASVNGIGRISRERFEGGTGGYRYAGEEYALHDLGLLVGQGPARAEGQAQVPLLLVRAGDLRAAVAIDQVVGNREIVVKPVGMQIASVPGIYGATITGDGRVVVILDVAPLVRRHLARPERPEARAESQQQRHVPLVMVVDDSLTMRKVTGRVLERHNLEVVTARDGIEALERLDERVPDLMLLDIEMPRMDGYELATAMRADARFRDVPIVMITSRTGDKHRQRAFEIGVQRYLGKPYQELDLMRNVYDLLGIARARD